MTDSAVIAPMFGTVTFAIADAGAALIVLLIAFGAPLPDWKLPRRIAALAAGLTMRPRLCVLLAGLSAPIIRLALLPLVPVPQPFSPNEFSYLLAADTFASGRLANPTHPMWVHFETIHVNQQPTYMSMYFPAQGLVLAFGKVMFGNPWFGVLISVGLMCAAICWMLQGWLSPGWATLGAFLVVLRLGVLGYWMNSYWGGAVSATGGALLMGALPRLIRYPRIGTALWMGVGIGILAISRPYEGVVLCIPAAMALVWWMAGAKRPPFTIVLRRVILPAAAVLVVTAGALAYYDWRVYGSPATLPYQTNRATYAVSPVFLWQTPRPEPEYRHKVLRDFYTVLEFNDFKRARTAVGFLRGAVRRVVTIVDFFFGAALAIPLLMLPRLLHDPRGRFLLAASGVYFLGLLSNAFIAPHYLAPSTALCYGILMLSMEQLQIWRPGGRPAGAFLVVAIPVLCVGLFGVYLASVAMSPKTDLPRTQVQHRLEDLPGRQLAIVRYVPGHNPLEEWVYNAADIDGSKVVWAREMGGAADRELIEYFKGRGVWLVEADETPPKVTPYAR